MYLDLTTISRPNGTSIVTTAHAASAFSHWLSVSLCLSLCTTTTTTTSNTMTTTTIAIAAAIEAAVGHNCGRPDMASLLWAASTTVGDEAAASLDAAAQYVKAGGWLPSAGYAETFGGRCNAERRGLGTSQQGNKFHPPAR
jgi:hypothetical protein